MDEMDMAILKAMTDLKTDHLDKLSEETGIPKSTVHYRLKNLREEGVIRNELGAIDWEKLGFEITVVTNVKAEYDEGYSESIGDQIADIEGVAYVFWVMGDVDFIVISHLPNQTELQKLFEEFHSIDAILETSTTYTVETLKENPNPLSNYDLETLNEIHDLDDT